MWYVGVSISYQDVHDRALLYYRLLQVNVEAAERVINPTKNPVAVFSGDQSAEAKDRIFDEFNSLAVVYRKVDTLTTSYPPPSPLPSSSLLPLSSS